MQNKSKSYRLILTLSLIGLVVGLVLLLSSCKTEASDSKGAKGDSSPLKAGYIDSEKLLENCAEYRDFLPQKESHREKMRELLRPGNTLSDKDKEYIKKTTLDFMKKEEAIIEKLVGDIRTASKVVASEKKLDIIINNPESSQIIEFGGLDVTSEVQAKLSQLSSETTKKPGQDKGKTE